MSSPTETTLQELVLLSCQGDSVAFRRLFDVMHDRVFRYILSRTSHREDALDITQEVFIDLWTALSKFQYRNDGEFYSFVFTVAKRKLIKHYRSRKDTIELNENTVTASYDMPFEDYRQLERWVEHLKPKYQELLRLRYWSGMSFAEIASVLHIREGTAKVWHHRAVHTLEKLASSQV